LPGGEPVLKTRAPRTQSFFDFDFGWLELIPGWWWAALAIGCGFGILLTILIGVL
jgi:hypothetical protein